MTPQPITLERTGDRSVSFTGNLVSSFRSPNFTSADRDTSARQWIVIDLYTTAAGTQIAQVQYRAGSKLGREEPKDFVFSAKTLTELFDLVKMVDPETQLVTPQTGTGPDAERWYDTSCRYARKEFLAALNKFSHHVTQHGGAELIE